MITVRKRYRQMDGQTIYCGITALLADTFTGSIGTEAH